jgi:hypothetical protein
MRHHQTQREQVVCARVAAERRRDPDENWCRGAIELLGGGVELGSADPGVPQRRRDLLERDLRQGRLQVICCRRFLDTFACLVGRDHIRFEADLKTVEPAFPVPGPHEVEIARPGWLSGPEQVGDESPDVLRHLRVTFVERDRHKRMHTSLQRSRCILLSE